MNVVFVAILVVVTVVVLLIVGVLRARRRSYEAALREREAMERRTRQVLEEERAWNARRSHRAEVPRRAAAPTPRLDYARSGRTSSKAPNPSNPPRRAPEPEPSTTEFFTAPFTFDASPPSSAYPSFDSGSSSSDSSSSFDSTPDTSSSDTSSSSDWSGGGGDFGGSGSSGDY